MQGLNTSIQYTPKDTSKPHKPKYTSPICSSLGILGIQDTNRHQQTPSNTNRRSKTPKKTVQGCVALHVDIWLRLLVSLGVFWCLAASFCVLWCREMWGGCLRSFWKGIWVLFMDLFKVWVPPREHLSVQALFGAACFILENLRTTKFHTPDIF